MCKTFKKVECGHEHFYSIVIVLAITPILLLRRLAAVGVFSVVILCFTFLAIGIIVYLSARIFIMTAEEASETYHIQLTEDDRVYNQWDTSMLPLFCATMMTLFEGNQQILNVYAEIEKSQDFFTIALVIILVLTLLIACTVGYLGYLAFGSTTKSLILYNLPNGDSLAITAKICYILTIMGSFTLVIQPIYYILERGYWYKENLYAVPPSKQK